jgi:FG-GAP-like repeat
MFKNLSAILVLLTFSHCTKKQQIDNKIDVVMPPTVYEYLPENLIAKDDAKQVTARYTLPTTRYAHGILGDQIEGGGLLVTVKDKQYHYKLADAFVFEDLQPRLADVDNDGALEFVTIQSSLTQGGSVAVYKIVNDSLQPFLSSGYIGSSSRWLNIAAIADLDNDGKMEIAWVQTPHIGGILKIARIENSKWTLLDEKSGVTNHRIGSKNLCLSVLTATTPLKTLYIPTQVYDMVKGFQLQNGKIVETETFNLAVNSSISLFEQYNFRDRILDIYCINP